MQSAGVGRELLRLAWEHGEGATGHVILSSRDSRAVRAYAKLGLELHPSISAVGVPAAAAEGPPLRAGGAADLDFTDAVDRAVRGAAHGEDLLAAVQADHELLVLPDRGYAVVRDGVVRLLAAFDEDGARELLRAVLARTRRAGRAGGGRVDHLRAGVGGGRVRRGRAGAPDRRGSGVPGRRDGPVPAIPPQWCVPVIPLEWLPFLALTRCRSRGGTVRWQSNHAR